ncbi:MAG: MMPL family transporter [Nitrospinota bacterium]|nr:MMPL family transporter [Nitrospinota bacterium]
MAKLNFGSKLALKVIKYRFQIIILTVLSVAVSSAGLAYLTFSSDSRAYFGPDNPQLKALEKLENTYSRDDSVLLAIAPKDGNIFSARTLSIIGEITDEFWKLPFSSRVESLTNYQHTSADGDELIVENLVKEADELTGADLDRIREIAVNEPFLKDRLVSSKGSVAGVVALFRMPENKNEATKEVVGKVRAYVKEVKKKYPDMEIYLVGSLMVDTAFAEAGEDDMRSLIPIMFAIMVFFMWVMLRSVTAMLVTTLVIIFSSVVSMGIAGWLGIVLTAPSANSPIVILTLSIADSIHVLVTMLQEIRKGRSREEAIVESMRINLSPVFLTTITTSIGFLSMNFSDSPPFWDLGNIVSIGVLVAFIYSVTFLPAMMAILPIKVGEEKTFGPPIIDRFADFVVSKSTALMWGMALFIIFSVSGISRIDVNDLYLDYFGKKFQFRKDTDFIVANLTGVSMVEYDLSSGEEGGVSSPEYLDTLERFTVWLLAQPEVKQISGFHDVMKRLNKSMHGDDPAYYKVPDRRDLAAQYLLLYEMSLPFGLDMNNMINVDKSSTRFRISLIDIYNREIRQFERRATAWLEENAPPSMHVDGTGMSIIFAHITDRTINSMFRGTAFALFLISGLLILAFMNLRIGLISLLPNIVPALMTFGLWGYTVSQVGLAASVIAALSLGIVVDDTIHFLSKYLRARKELGLSPEMAVRYSFHTVGRALVITSVILVAGFGILTLSNFKVNSNIGTLTAIAIAIALIVDFLFLPALLLKLEKRR